MSVRYILILANLIFYCPIYSQDIYDFNSVKEDATNIVVPSVKAPYLSKPSDSLESSARGFCSVEQAADKLLRLSNSNTLGVYDSGLLEGYLAKVKKDCGPVKYIPQQIIKPGTPRLVCYKLTGECFSNEYSRYNESNCALETEKNKLQKIYSRMLFERDRRVEEHMRVVKEKAMKAAVEIVSKKLTKKLADNPFEQLRLSWGDMYEMRKELAKVLSEKYAVYNMNVVINSVGEFMFSNFEYISPMIALSGPAGFIVLGGLPIVEETFQCNISIKNILLKGGLAATKVVVIKVPIIKSESVAGVFADRFIKNATITEVSKWVKHFFGDGLEVENVSIVKEYGKEFAVITLKSVFSTGQHYSK